MGVSNAPAAPPISTFTKSGTDAATNSTANSGGPAGITAANDVIQWVLSYRNTTTETADVNITDPITGNQGYVPGSLKSPPDLARQWSTNGGSSYVTSEPGSGVDTVGAQGTSVPGSTGGQALASAPPPLNVVGSGGGDGFEALFPDDGNIYNIFHHSGGTLPNGNPVKNLDCHLRSTGATCPGYPTYVSPNAGDDLGTGPSTLVTATFNQGAVVGNKIYFPAAVVGGTREGVGCVNVATLKSCGFTQLGTSIRNNANNTTPTINGGALLGSRFYVIGQRGDIFCLDTATDTACPTIPLTVTDPTMPTPTNSTYNNLQAWDGRYLFGTITHTTGAPIEKDLVCFDVTTNTRCPGFPKVKYGGISAGNLFDNTLVPILNNSGGVMGICANAAQNFTQHPFNCFDLDGNSVATPFSETQTTGTAVNAFNYGSIAVIGTRIYFGETVQSSGRVTYTCWDYSVTPSAPGKTGNVCPGFAPATSNAKVIPYTLRQDSQNPGCIWAYGDAARFEVFSATFGGIGCTEGNATVNVKPDDFYCDGQGPHATAWDKITLGGIVAADYDGAAVSITDQNGNPVPGWQNKIITPAQGQTIDISSIPYSGTTTTLRISVSINWGSKTVKPVTVSAFYTGDAPQVCFQTKVGAATCAEARQITNNANAVTNAGAGSSDAPDGSNAGVVTFTESADPNLGDCPPPTPSAASAAVAAATQASPHVCKRKRHGHKRCHRPRRHGPFTG